MSEKQPTYIVKFEAPLFCYWQDGEAIADQIKVIVGDDRALFPVEIYRIDGDVRTRVAYFDEGLEQWRPEGIEHEKVHEILDGALAAVWPQPNYS